MLIVYSWCPALWHRSHSVIKYFPSYCHGFFISPLTWQAWYWVWWTCKFFVAPQCTQAAPSRWIISARLFRHSGVNNKSAYAVFITLFYFVWQTCNRKMQSICILIFLFKTCFRSLCKPQPLRCNLFALLNLFSTFPRTLLQTSIPSMQYICIIICNFSNSFLL